LTYPLITEPSFYAIAISAVLLLGISKSGFGTGFGSLAVPPMATSLVLLPLVPLGVGVGVRMARRIGPVHFYRLTYVGLFLTGTKLVWDASA
jgi:uncharacterized protein